MIATNGRGNPPLSAATIAITKMMPTAPTGPKRFLPEDTTNPYPTVPGVPMVLMRFRDMSIDPQQV